MVSNEPDLLGFLAVTDSYEYDAFGNSFTVSGSTPNNYLYRGEQYDPDLGLYYLRARSYNPGTGRFMSRDPEDRKIRDSNGKPIDPKALHKYLYALGDSVNRIDPRGRDSIINYAVEIGESEESIAALRATKVAVDQELFDSCVELQPGRNERLRNVRGNFRGCIVGNCRSLLLNPFVLTWTVVSLF